MRAKSRLRSPPSYGGIMPRTVAPPLRDGEGIMERRRLSELEVSAIGLGCATMTPFYGYPDPASATATIRRAPGDWDRLSRYLRRLWKWPERRIDRAASVFDQNAVGLGDHR